MATTKKIVYLDHAATTPLRSEVLLTMKPYLTTQYGNASALYAQGTAAHAAIAEARALCAQLLHATDDTIIFTSGGTESCNLAILGAARAQRKHGTHIITSVIEHHAVLNACRQLEREGFTVTYLPVDAQGLVQPEDVYRALRPETILVSIMAANNEIGTIEPVAEIGKRILRWRKAQGGGYPLFHSDACQAAGYLDLDVEKLHVDLLSLNSGKIYGPKGVGCLYLRRGVSIEPLLYGGNQERGFRPGTENVAGIVGFARAFELVRHAQVKEARRLRTLSLKFYQLLKKISPKLILNGPDFSELRLPNNVNITFPGIEAETLLLYLDRYGIMASTGSACAARSIDSSHVLVAIGRTEGEAKGSVRFTLGKGTTLEQLRYVNATCKMIFKKFF